MQNDNIYLFNHATQRFDKHRLNGSRFTELRFFGHNQLEDGTIYVIGGTKYQSRDGKYNHYG